MDEADALAQRIGIMAGGKLRVLGSPQHLKSTHGGGYSVQLSGPADKADAMAELVHATFGTAKLLESHSGRQQFDISSSFDLAAAFQALESAKEAGDLNEFSLSQTTLEQVFLNIAAAQEV
jgi:ABC-type multidrug transport system ATPase subunit